MNYYIVTYRLSTDKNYKRRYWEGPAEDNNDLVAQIMNRVVVVEYNGVFPLYPPRLIFVSCREYIDIFK